MDEQKNRILDLEADTRELLDWEPSFPKVGDTLFQPSASGACVDPIGSSSPIDQQRPSPGGRWGLYTIGFLKAGDRLVDSLKPDEMATPPGAALLYPVLFLYRHYVELELKGILVSRRHGWVFRRI